MASVEGQPERVCALPGCENVLTYSGRGRPPEYCSTAHKNQAFQAKRGLTASGLEAPLAAFTDTVRALSGPLESVETALTAIREQVAAVSDGALVRVGEAERVADERVAVAETAAADARRRADQAEQRAASDRQARADAVAEAAEATKRARAQVRDAEERVREAHAVARDAERAQGRAETAQQRAEADRDAAVAAREDADTLRARIGELERTLATATTQHETATARVAETQQQLQNLRSEHRQALAAQQARAEAAERRVDELIAHLGGRPDQPTTDTE